MFLSFSNVLSVRKYVAKKKEKVMASYGETSGFTELGSEELVLVNGGKGFPHPLDMITDIGQGGQIPLENEGKDSKTEKTDTSNKDKSNPSENSGGSCNCGNCGSNSSSDSGGSSK
jgi:hypothetical protein